MHRVLSLSILLLIMSAALQASTCVPGTLTSYEQQTVACNIGNLFYSNFSFPNPPSGGDTSDEIWVAPASQGFTFQQTPDFGVTFTPFTSTTPITYTIGYSFVIDPVVVAGADLGMDPPFGDVTITNIYCTDSFINSDGFCQSPTGGFRPDILQVHTNPTNPTNPCIDPVNGGNTCFDSILFTNPATVSGDVLVEIHINGDPNTPAGFDSTSTDTFFAPDVPEPASLVLIPCGLLLLPIRRRLLSMRPAERA